MPYLQVFAVFAAAIALSAIALKRCSSCSVADLDDSVCCCLKTALCADVLVNTADRLLRLAFTGFGARTALSFREKPPPLPFQQLVWHPVTALKPVSSAAYFHADFYSFDPERGAWTEITDHLSGPRIPGRCGHGFAAAGGMLYVYGGSGEVGETPNEIQRNQC